MKCPECKSRVRVIDSVPIDEHNEVYRRRLCVECGHEFYTTEMIVEPTKRFKNEWAQNRYYNDKTTRMKKENQS